MKTGYRNDDVKVKKSTTLHEHQSDIIDSEIFKHLLTDTETSTVLSVTDKYELNPDLQEA